MESRSVTLRCYPKDNRPFEEYAHAALREALVQGGRPEEIIRELETRLRERYPETVVHRRDRLAEPPDERGEVWYVYRNGSPMGAG